MAQNLRNLFEEDNKNKQAKMSGGHEARFLEKLNKEFPEIKKQKKFNILNIAASVIIVLGLSYGAFQLFEAPTDIQDHIEVVDTEADSSIKTLGDVSPDLKKVEDYYLASIHLELSKIQLTPENKELVDGYLARLQELNEEYKRLTLELSNNGLNEETLNAHIDNLKFRLNLVIRLKEKLQEFSSDEFPQDII